MQSVPTMLIDFPISLLVVDDHKMFRKAVVDVLQGISSNCLVLEAGNGVECIARLENQLFDLVLLDINMPEMDGIECMKIIHERWPEQRVSALTQYDQMGFLRKMQELGAIGYLSKTTEVDELTDNVLGMVLENLNVYPQNIAGNLDEIVELLSNREFELLELLSKELSSVEIAKKLDISVNTVNNHRVSILKKLKLKNTTSVVKWAIKNGFTSKPEF